MTKKIQNKMNELLNELKTAELSDKTSFLEEHYFISKDNNDHIWKYKKQFSAVVSGFVTFYELWNKRLIARVFFIWQGWENKEKIKKIIEVQRYLGGSEYKLSRHCYQGNYSTKCLIGYPFYNNNKREWEKIKNHSLDVLEQCYRGSYNYGIMGVSKFPKYLFNKNAENSLHKYSGFNESGWPEYKIFEYLALYEKHPQIEMFAKLDLMWALEKGMNYFRWSKKGLAILGIQSKDELKYLKACPDIGFYRRNKELLHKLKIDSTDKLTLYQGMSYFKIEVTTKLFNYLLSQGDRISSWTAHQYKDYLDFVDRLGLPKTNRNLYPKNLKKAHDELSDKIEILKCKEKDNLIKNRVTEQLYKLRFANSQFVITPANSIEDLIVESKVLNHCVRTYADKYAEGITNIFLVRTREDVNTPFYTLELSNSKNIEQLRGSHNCAPTEKVIEFINEWSKKFKITGEYVTR